ncbi:hypothetical protein SAMN05444414_10348 [Roseovarius marisflavi]|uniref:Beta-barrel assembly machine subunit BamF n=2 Tax=Roseovarius marisflavi TaxID=1054996 RepID=A0A1M6WQE0_9RHOB|nr:hypothetical protein SAMN05444414_10348 [Roseovarius marisflavi]
MRLCPAPILAAMAVSLIAGCDPFPAFEVSESARAAAYPALVPVEEIVSQVPAEAIAPETSPDLAARAARLKARAARLKGSVVDAETQKRMQTGVK